MSQNQKLAPQLLTDQVLPRDYQPVILSGQLLPSYRFYITGQLFNGKFGKYLIMPLALPNGHIILIHRGWVSSNDEVAISPSTKVSFTATVHYPVLPRWQWSISSISDWSWIDITRAEKWMKKKLLPFYAIAHKNLGDKNVFPIQPPQSPNHHLSYALTWFSLAVSFCILLWLLLKDLKIFNS